MRFGVWRLMTAPLARRKSRAVLSITALALAAAMVTALLTVYRGVEQNLSRDFRSSGANLIVTPTDAAGLLPPAAASAALAALPSADSGSEILNVVGAADDHAIVIAGAPLDRLLAVNRSWRLAGRMPAAGEAWLGVNAARLLEVQPGGSVTVAYAGREQDWPIVGLIDAGTSEDNQLLAPLSQVESLTGLEGYTTLEVRAGADPADVDAASAILAARLPQATIRPVRPIAASEGEIILHTRGLLLATSLLILLTVALCVAAALTTLAIERRRDFGIMKALGGGESQVLIAFVGEAVAMALVAAVVGAAVGTVAAGVMGQALFGVWFVPTAGVLATAAALTAILAALAALAPWPIMRQATPAAILRGN